MTGERKDLPEQFRFDDATGVWLPTRQYQNQLLCNTTEEEVKVFDCIKRTYICTLPHERVKAAAALRDSECLVTVSGKKIKFWDSACLLQSRPEKPTEELDCNFTLWALDPTDILLYALPGDKQFILCDKYNFVEAFLIDFAEKQVREIPMRRQQIQDAVFIEPCYWVCSHDFGLTIDNIRAKDFFNKQVLYEYGFSNIQSICAWPGGRVWALGEFEGPGKGLKFTICSFERRKPLKKLMELPDRVMTDRGCPQPFVLGNEFFYCSENRLGFVTIKAFDLQKRTTRFVFKDGRVEFLYATSAGALMSVNVPASGYRSMTFFPANMPPTKKDVYDVIYDSITIFPRPLVSMVAEYAADVVDVVPSRSFFRPVEVDEKLIFTTLDGLKRTFEGEDKKSETYRDEIKQLMQLIVTEPKTFDECIAECPQLTALLQAREKDKAKSALTSLFSKKALTKQEDTLADYLLELKELGKNRLGEYKLR